MKVTITIYVNNNAKQDEIRNAIAHTAIRAEGMFSGGVNPAQDSKAQLDLGFMPTCFESAHLEVDYRG